MKETEIQVGYGPDQDHMNQNIQQTLCLWIPNPSFSTVQNSFLKFVLVYQLHIENSVALNRAKMNL